MELLKKIFPLSFGREGVGMLILFTLIYLVANVLLAVIPVVGIVITLYCFTGIALLYLDYFKLLK